MCVLFTLDEVAVIVLRAPVRVRTHASLHSCVIFGVHVQYLDIWAKAGVLLALPPAVIGVACACLLGSLWAAAIIVVVLASLLLHLMALMFLAGRRGSLFLSIHLMWQEVS